MAFENKRRDNARALTLPRTRVNEMVVGQLRGVRKVGHWINSSKRPRAVAIKVRTIVSVHKQSGRVTVQCTVLLHRAFQSILDRYLSIITSRSLAAHQYIQWLCGTALAIMSSNDLRSGKSWIKSIKLYPCNFSLLLVWTIYLFITIIQIFIGNVEFFNIC